MAKYHMADIFRGNFAALQHGLQNRCTQIAGRYVFEPASKIANSCTARANNDNFFHFQSPGDSSDVCSDTLARFQ
jgi:hypothetical protein